MSPDDADHDGPGRRALRAAQAELVAGVREVPLGSNSGPRIKEYLAGCVRDYRRSDGSIKRRPVGLDHGEWCAAFASWCAFTTSDPGEIPHAYRISVAELWKDAKASGAARGREYLPKVGDLGVYRRDGNDPTRGGKGHVARVCVPPGADGLYETIDGNSQDRVTQVRRKVADAAGWIVYGAEPTPLTARALSETGWLDDLARALDDPPVDVDDAVWAFAPLAFSSLRAEYERLYESCVIRPERSAAVEAVVDRMLQHRERYERAGAPLCVPWYFIAAVHSLEEGSLRFAGHLHNGDPLTARTIHVPAGRPRRGEPPFTWEESATDALRLKRLDAWREWGVAGTLYQLERYNGFGYRRQAPPVPSPYLWSFSTHHVKGKYVADGRYDPEAVSRQCGGAVALKALERRVSFWPRG